MEYNKRDIFSGNHAEIEAGGLVPNLFLLLKKVLYEIKASGLQISFNIFRQPSAWHIKTNWKNL